MMLTRLSLSGVRNYSALEFQPEPGLNVLIGANAQGKSNLLEAISLLATGKSFRTSREAELIASGRDSATISGEARLRAGSIRLACTISSAGRGTRKLYSINSQSVRYAAFLGSIKVVTFAPGDLQLVDGAPALRRALLNMALSQAQPLYYRNLARYRKTLVQKMALLRGSTAPDRDLLNIYNAELVRCGAEIMLARSEYVATLSTFARSIHGAWVHGTESFTVEYAPSVPIEVPTVNDVAGALAKRLAEAAPLEVRRGISLAGPHRDDLRLLMDGKSLSAFGSQGQQRSAVLALKLAEYTVLRQRCEEAPLLLLDDVLSELDNERAGEFLQSIGRYEQAFLTATQAPPEMRASARYAVNAATLERVA
ncbi:MAG: DNA replication/repair protein RecF [Candidatus Eremiobacteraeota bacterium]|nr:DNA replication/repair protein RecF [Candidatus Eremiobacteraeota bacterium]